MSGNGQNGAGIETIFHAALEIREADKRAAYLERACADDAELRARVERFLEAEERAGEFMAEAPGAQLEKVGDRIGPYKLLQVLGEGGMGTVYMAEQSEPVERRVTLKIIKPGMDSADIVARFEAERQALALMEHPGIARVLDAGATPTGRPYFAMELVKGVRITEYCDAHELPPRRRLELLVQVCRAVHHAHQKGIIHRDLKPANVLVADYDDRAVPKVIDFGVAKATGRKLTEKTMFTQFGQIIGTFEYMSPEQAKLNQLDVDTRADIYSLGVLLYELLTSTTPFDPGRLQVVGFEEILRIIREEEPPKPSTRISSLGERTALVAASRGSNAHQLSRDLRGELDWIVMRAMDKDRNRRYESAAALADDIERYLRDETVHACPPSKAYRVRKFVRRHRRPVIAAAALVLVLILGLVGTSIGFFEARRAEQDAVTANFSMAFDRGLHLCEDGHVGHGMLWLARALEICPEDDPAMERVVRANLNAWRQELNHLKAVLPHEKPVFSVAFSPDGERLVTGSNDLTAQVWDLRTGDPVGAPLPHGGDVHDIQFSADGARMLTTNYRRMAYVWDVGSDTPALRLEHGTEGSPPVVAGAAFRPPDDAELVTSCGDGTVAIWDARTGDALGRLPDAHQSMVHDVAVSPDGSRILTSGHDGIAKVWDFESRTLLATFKHEAEVVTADFCGNDRIVTGDADGRVLLWSVADARAAAGATLDVAAAQPMDGHLGTVHRLRVNAAGTRVLTASFDTTAQLWDPAHGVAVGPKFEHQAAVWGIAFAPGGDRIATACDDNVARVWQPAAGQSVHAVPHEISFDHPAVFSPDGRYVLVKTDEGTAVVSDAATRAELCVLRVPGGIRAFAVSRDRSRVLTGGADGTCWLWDVVRAAPVCEPFRHGKGVWSVDVSADGTRTLTGGFDGSLQVRNARSGAVLRDVDVGSRVQGVAFSADGERFVAGGADKSAYLYTTGLDAPPLALTGHQSAVFSPAFSRDGTRVATGSHDCTVRLFDAATGQPMGDPMRHPGPITYSIGATFSPDGRTVATASSDGGVRVWDVATSRRVGPALHHGTRVLMVAFTTDSEIRTGTSDGVVRFWSAERSAIEGDLERVRLWVEVITGYELDDAGALRGLDGRTWRARRARLLALGGPPTARR